jgi:hypothetical protein
MITVNSVSGGKTSAYIAVHYPADHDVFSVVCLEDVACAPKDKYLIDYANKKLSPYYTSRFGEFVASAESDATLLALIRLEQKLGREITWVRGDTFEEVIRSRGGFLPNKLRRICTTEMKIRAIFEWWYLNIHEKVEMRIGYRKGEYLRMERFMNNDPNHFRIPTSCATYGDKKQKHESFLYRYCSFPLIRDGVDHSHIINFWRNNKTIQATLFSKEETIEFPLISNCRFCFEKKVETLSIMANQEPEAMSWAANQEESSKGQWKDGIKYKDIIHHSENWLPEMLKEVGSSCDSGGCHD